MNLKSRKTIEKVVSEVPSKFCVYGLLARYGCRLYEKSRAELESTLPSVSTFRQWLQQTLNPIIAKIKQLVSVLQEEQSSARKKINVQKSADTMRIQKNLTGFQTLEGRKLETCGTAFLTSQE